MDNELLNSQLSNSQQQTHKETLLKQQSSFFRKSSKSLRTVQFILRYVDYLATFAIIIYIIKEKLLNSPYEDLESSFSNQKELDQIKNYKNYETGKWYISIILVLVFLIMERILTFFYLTDIKKFKKSRNFNKEKEKNSQFYSDKNLVDTPTNNNTNTNNNNENPLMSFQNDNNQQFQQNKKPLNSNSDLSSYQKTFHNFKSTSHKPNSKHNDNNSQINSPLNNRDSENNSQFNSFTKNNSRMNESSKNNKKLKKIEFLPSTIQNLDEKYREEILDTKEKVQIILVCLFFVDFLWYEMEKQVSFYYKQYCRKLIIEVYCQNIVFTIISFMLFFQLLLEDKWENDFSTILLVSLSFISSLYQSTYKIYESYMQRMQQLEEIETKENQSQFQKFKQETQLFLTNPFHINYFKQISSDIYYYPEVFRKCKKKNNSLVLLNDFRFKHQIYTSLYIALQILELTVILVLSEVTIIPCNVKFFLIYGILFYFPYQIIWYLNVLLKGKFSWGYKLNQMAKILLGLPLLALLGFGQVILPVKCDQIPLINSIKETWPVNIMSSWYLTVVRQSLSFIWLYCLQKIMFDGHEYYQNSQILPQYINNFSSDNTQFTTLFYVSVSLWSLITLSSVLQILYFKIFQEHSHIEAFKVPKNNSIVSLRSRKSKKSSESVENTLLSCQKQPKNVENNSENMENGDNMFEETTQQLNNIISTNRNSSKGKGPSIFQQSKQQQSNQQNKLKKIGSSCHYQIDQSAPMSERNRLKNNSQESNQEGELSLPNKSQSSEENNTNNTNNPNNNNKDKYDNNIIDMQQIDRGLGRKLSRKNLNSLGNSIINQQLNLLQRSSNLADSENFFCINENDRSYKLMQVKKQQQSKKNSNKSKLSNSIKMSQHLKQSMSICQSGFANMQESENFFNIKEFEPNQYIWQLPKDHKSPQKAYVYHQQLQDIPFHVNSNKNIPQTSGLLSNRVINEVNENLQKSEVDFMEKATLSTIGLKLNIKFQPQSIPCISNNNINNLKKSLNPMCDSENFINIQEMQVKDLHLPSYYVNDYHPLPYNYYEGGVGFQKKDQFGQI